MAVVEIMAAAHLGADPLVTGMPLPHGVVAETEMQSLEPPGPSGLPFTAPVQLAARREGR